MTLDELEKLTKEATPGPWVADSETGPPTVWYSEINSGVSVCDANSQDAEFIAAARTYMPKLLAVARLAEEAVEHALWLDGGQTLAFGLERAMRERLRAALAALESEGGS